MPKNNTPRIALLATSLVVVGGIAVTSLIAQSAVAEPAAPNISAAFVTKAAQLRALETARDARIAELRADDLAAAAAAAQAAFLLTPAGAQATAQTMASAQYGWGDDQFQCLVQLWDRESGWNVSSFNADSGATGIPQALPGEKMAIMGADWQTNPATQIAWGLSYISSGYGTPCGAWNHSENYNWY